MEERPEYLTEALEMIGNQPAAIIEQPHQRLVLQKGIGEEWTVAWVKLSTAFKPHIKELRGAPLAVWLYISLSINKSGISFPSVLRIAEDTGYSHQGVLDAIKTLESKGYLRVRRGERRYNLYEPEFAAIGKTNEPSETVNLVESSKLSQVLQPNESTFSPNESTPLDSNKSNKIEPELLSQIETSANRTIDAILQSLAPKSIRDAIHKHFRLSPNWDSKRKWEREFLSDWMEWAMAENITEAQIETAANVWRTDKRFSWKAPDLRGIRENWPMLIESATTSDFESEYL